MKILESLKRWFKKEEKIPNFEPKNRNNSAGESYKRACISILKRAGIVDYGHIKEGSKMKMWRNELDDFAIWLCNYKGHEFFIIVQRDPDNNVTYLLSSDL